MALSDGLINVLACPKCKGPVEIEEDHGAILCQTCNLKFPVRDEIPVMLIDEATAIEI